MHTPVLLSLLVFPPMDENFHDNVHVAKDRRGKLDPKTRPCIFLGYGDDEFGYRVWDSVDKKVFRSRDIICMEDKTLADWESEKKIMNPDVIRTHPAESRLTLEEPAGYGEDAEPIEEAEEAEIGTDQDPESDLDEEEILEPVAESLGRRYPLRERRPP